MKRLIWMPLYLALHCGVALGAPIPMVKMPNMKPLVSPTGVISTEAFEGFEELTGRELRSSEINQIQRISDQVRELNQDEGVHKASWNLGKTGYQFTVLICGQFKLQVDSVIPQKVKDGLTKLPTSLQNSVNGFMAKGSGEIQPCLDPHSGISYLMVGASHTIGAPTLISGGLTIGIYFSPTTEKIAIGNYLFGRFTWNLGSFGKWEITGGGDAQCAENIPKMEFDFSKCQRFFISTGLGFDLGGALWSKLKTLRQRAESAPANVAGGKTLDLGAWTFSYGIIVKVQEFPWYERLRQGMGVRQAFADLTAD